MGTDVIDSTKIAILNANYVAKKLAPYFPVLYTGRSGFVALQVPVRPSSLR